MRSDSLKRACAVPMSPLLMAKRPYPSMPSVMLDSWPTSFERLSPSSHSGKGFIEVTQAGQGIRDVKIDPLVAVSQHALSRNALQLVKALNSEGVVARVVQVLDLRG